MAGLFRFAFATLTAVLFVAVVTGLLCLFAAGVMWIAGRLIPLAGSGIRRD
jgi:hypothetical protein